MARDLVEVGFTSGIERIEVVCNGSDERRFWKMKLRWGDILDESNYIIKE